MSSRLFFARALGGVGLFSGVRGAVHSVAMAWPPSFLLQDELARVFLERESKIQVRETPFPCSDTKCKKAGRDFPQNENEKSKFVCVSPPSLIAI